MGANRKKPADDRSGRLQCEFDLRAEKKLAVSPISLGAQVVSGSNIASLPREPSVRPGALRSPACRRRQKAKRDGVTVPDVTHVTAPATSTVTHRDEIAALGVAGVSAYFNVTGLVAIFAGATLPATFMGIALEAGKLSATAWLGRRRFAPITLRVAVAALVLVLTMMNSIEVFGALSQATLAHAVAGKALVDHHAAQADADIAVQADIVNDLDHQVAQIDATVHADTSRGRTKSALAIIAEQSHARADLVVRRETAAEKLALLRVQRAAVAGERRKVEADDLGPLRFLSALFGFGTEQTMRAFVLAVSLSLDPSAVLLLLAATTRRGAR
jgi:hypothetical protein